MIQAINQTNTVKQAPKPKVYFSAPVTMLPEGNRNYCIFNQNKVNFLVSQKKNALPYLKNVLQTSNDEKEIVESLYILDRLIDNGTKGIPHMYPILARFNDSKSPNIQSYLAGIYRKTQVPDAFGPLISMLIKNSIVQDAKCKMQNAKGEQEAVNSEQAKATPLALLPSRPPFDPNEEIGGAILEYIRNYSQGPKPIDFSA